MEFEKNKNPKSKILIDVVCIFCCEWNMCTYSAKKMEDFLQHIIEHVSTLSDTPTGDNSEFTCIWRNCGFSCTMKLEMDRHIYFHAFHSKIKAKGEILMRKKNLQCPNDNNTQNMVPEIPLPFQCMWDDCQDYFISAQNFYWHVEAHSLVVNVLNDNKMQCLWQDCTSKVKTKAKLREHLRSHTQEKLTGCPVCGGIFSNNSRLTDHCLRRKDLESLHFKCCHCTKGFASERLLREHVRSHINNFKCSLCEMTTTSKTNLQTHMKFRHSDNKPFNCPQCPRRYKSMSDAVKHYGIHHADEPAFVCPYIDCKFSCKSNKLFLKHARKVHQAMPSVYNCHICNKLFNYGFRLTAHLKNQHNFHWPAGHTRFRYKRDEDGYYRLQTTRIESIELAESILRENTTKNNDPLSDDKCLKVEDEDIDEPSMEIVVPINSVTQESTVSDLETDIEIEV